MPITENKLRDKYWRMNNLYWITDKNGERVKFLMNAAQRWLWENTWHLNVILKARQLGFTTFIDLYILDECIFNSNVEAGIIAHTLPDAKDIFRRKIRFPYENLPEDIRAERECITDNKTEIQWGNGSVMRVGNTLRSSTLQYLHVSELGKLSAKYPDKAKEVMTGAMNAVGSGNTIIWVESTAEGRGGEFFDLVQRARKNSERGTELTRMDWRFMFFPWIEAPEYHLDADVPVSQKIREYFQSLEDEHGLTLTQAQKAWYIKKHDDMGEDMKREYPSTPEEAFEASVEGAYFTKQFARVYAEGRICSVPVVPGVLVDTWWDLGMDDSMSIWFTQDIGRELHILNFLEDSGEGFPYYRDRLVELTESQGYRYGRHVAPYDIHVRELGTGTSRLEQAAEIGLRFEVAPRVENKMDSIQAARKIMDICVFDEEETNAGVVHLENYRKEWDENRGVYKSHPHHDQHSHGADAYQTLATAHNWRPTATGRRRTLAQTGRKKSMKGYV
jgi:hypothetical protein